jgi:hypothetical protein
VTVDSPAAEVEGQPRDRGAMLIVSLVVITITAFIVVPAISYAVSVSRAGTVVHQKAIRVEAAKAGLRTALADPSALYRKCGYTDPANPGAGLNNPVQLAPLTLGGIPVSTTCYLLDYAYSNQGPSAGRYGVAHVLVGSTTPPGLAAAEKVYPLSGQAPPEGWVAATATRPATDTIWLPYLPAHGLNRRSAAGYSMPPEFPACKVFFPGTYVDDVVITGSTPVFFTSGIYYFEKSVRISGSADVVVGGGATTGCTTDQEAAFYAVGAPNTHNISGLGATFVFGAEGRLQVDTLTAGSGASVRFNLRYVAPTDQSTAPSAGVSIVTVNGTASGTGIVDLDVPGSLHVPASLVGSSPPTSAALQEYRPSTLVAPLATPVVSVQLTNAQPTTVLIPGYIAAPQGLVKVSTDPGAEANKKIEIAGGILSAALDVVGSPPSGWTFGLDDPVVQQTFRIVSRTSASPVVTSVAVVQINQNGAYAVNTWLVQ